MMFPEMRNMLDEDLQSRCVQSAWARVEKSLPRGLRKGVSIAFISVAIWACVGWGLHWWIGAVGSCVAYAVASYLFYCWQRMIVPTFWDAY